MQDSNWFLANAGLWVSLISCLATIVVAVAAYFKSRADKAPATRKGSRERGKNYAIYLVLIVLASFGSGLGSWMNKRSTDKANLRALEIHRETHRKMEALELEFKNKTSVLLAKLNVATSEESRLITEEKIRLLRDDFDEWAADFLTNLPSAKEEFVRSKEEQSKKQQEAMLKATQAKEQTSALVRPVFDFTIRYVQEAAKAYSGAKHETNVVVQSFQHPKNYFTTNTESVVRFNSNAVWRISIRRGSLPAGGYTYTYIPVLRISFVDSKLQESGYLELGVSNDAKKVRVNYRTPLPTPAPSSVEGEYDFLGYEVPIRSALRKVITAQLLNLETN